MIVRDKPGAKELLFAVRGSVLPQIIGHLAVVIGLSAALVVIHRHLLPLPQVNATPFALFGVALSLFLGFRNNAAYDRWWEARKLWGGVLADARSLAREAEMFLPDPSDRHILLHGMRGFVHLHRCALRGLAPDAAACRDLPPGVTATPDALLDALNSGLATAHRAGRLDGFGARALSARLGSVALAQAGCERIRATPLPYVYSLLVYRTTWLYCLLLPLALLGPAG